MNKTLGFIAAAGSYFLWGILPMYWKLVSEVPAFEILCHRMVWSLVVMLVLVLGLKRYQSLRNGLADKRNLVIFMVSSVLLSGNWFIYIWAVNNGYIVEASLGYFINPLLNVLFGMIFFGERMRPAQWCSLLLAFCSVVYLTVYYGHFPWIALGLAVSFAFYGVIHKGARLTALDGLFLETALLFLPAAVFLFFLEFQGTGAFGQAGTGEMLLLAGAGAVTTAPLLLFGYATKNIALSTMGMLQYLAPTISLLLGLFVYGEDFPVERLVGFLLIWTALFLFLSENLIYRKRLGKSLKMVKDNN